jgi:ATP-dependent DNA helicase RecG
MPNPATDKLIKILKLEAQTGYQDKAVTRGLASFSAAWLNDAARNSIDSAFAEQVAQMMRDYSTLTEGDTRRTALTALIDKLQYPNATPSFDASAIPQEQKEKPAQQPARREDARREEPRREMRSDNARPDETRYTSRVMPQQAGLGLDASVTKIAGIGDANAARLEKLGVKTIGDLLYFFPARYDDYSALRPINQLEYNDQVTLIARVASAYKRKTKTNLIIFTAVVEDASGMIECRWFTNERAADNMQKNMQVGREVVISGKVSEYLGKLIFQNPTFEPAEREWITGGRIVPIYPLTEGLQPLLLRRVMKRVSEYWSQRAPEFMPDDVRRAANLMPLPDALREIHFPRDPRAKENARRRLAFDELFVLQMAVLKQRQLWRGEPAQPLEYNADLLPRLIAALPYSLTAAQRRAIERISSDIRQPVGMRRLLQGDVGAGKTVVAALGMALAVSVGAQAAIMAPTEILAEQHYKNLQKLFEGFAAHGALQMMLPKINIQLLTGSVKAADKRDIYEQLASGEINVIVGTHALIQDAVQFKNLGFVVVDEQHRFGVEQRKALRQKGSTTNPHTLYMTATPIPRTLALTMYGDLDNTILDELPPGRQPITTHWFAPAERERAYAFVRSQVNEGRQAFIICPLVEESDKVEAKAAIEEHARLQRDVFPNLKLGLLHGRMKASEKEEVMSAFARNELQVLVSTSVVEVGIDVPNATVMMIEGANRFGLSQLHQFRGRVGRGQHPSFCLLLADSSSALSDERLQAIVSTQDGFKLADIDLQIRGPGEFFGTRQSGEPELRLVGIGDRDLLEQAREQAERVIGADSALSQPQHKLLADKVGKFWLNREKVGDAS